MSQEISQKHPPGLYVLFFTEMWERFSYYGMRAILLLFLLDKTSGGLGFEEGEGGAVYGIYTFSVYLLSLPGGWLADNMLGQRKAIWLGGIIIMLGHIVLAFPSTEFVFFSGLAMVAMGTGLLKPNISSIVSELYPEGGARRDAAFSIFYMGINLGSFLGIFVVGFLGQKIGWHYGFGAAAVAMLMGLTVFRYYAPKYLGEKGMYPKGGKNAPGDVVKTNALTWILLAVLVAFILFLQFNGTFAWDSKKGSATSMGIIAVAVVIVYFANLMFASHLSGIEVKRIVVLFILFWGAVLFWAGFEQQGSSLQIFADRYSEIPFGIPSSWFQNFNPFFLVVLSPVMGAFWIYLEKKKITLPLLVKFAIGLFLLAIGYYIMVVASKIALTGMKASSLFLISTFLFHTIGELFLSPVGLSAYTKLAPKKYLSQLMGVWFVAAALGNLFAGLFAGGFNAENIQQMPDMFMSIVWFCVIIGGVIFILQRPLKTWTGGIK